jgi:hypothetical protein
MDCVGGSERSNWECRGGVTGAVGHGGWCADDRAVEPERGFVAVVLISDIDQPATCALG